MKPSFQQHNDFLAHVPIEGVLFLHNSFVAVVAGEFAGQRGSVVSVERLGQDPAYLVELEAGTDAIIGQSQLRAIEA